VESTLKNTQPQAVKEHLLFEVRRTEVRCYRPKARILVIGTTATDFFAYFFHPRKKGRPHRMGKAILIFHKVLERDYVFLAFFDPLFWGYIQE